MTPRPMCDGVKITIIGVPLAQRRALKVACLHADASVSEVLRARIPQVIREVEGTAMTYEELAELLTAVTGILNMALAGMEPQAHAALESVTPELRRFQRQLHQQLHRPVSDY